MPWEHLPQGLRIPRAPLSVCVHYCQKAYCSQGKIIIYAPLHLGDAIHSAFYSLSTALEVNSECVLQCFLLVLLKSDRLCFFAARYFTSLAQSFPEPTSCVSFSTGCSLQSLSLSLSPGFSALSHKARSFCDEDLVPTTTCSVFFSFIAKSSILFVSLRLCPYQRA